MTLGIDLGTTYSVGAYVDAAGTPQIINNAEGSTLTPSVVMFDGADSIVVGEVAKDNAVIRPQDVISVVKNYMGKKMVLKEFNGQQYTPEMISSFIIRKVVQDSAAALGTEIDSAVITVPAYFTDAQRKATEDAAVMAGVHLAGMINEPTAAALCYVKKHNVQNENILIYDLGGGTFDVTILHVADSNNIEVLSTGGLSNAGGRFFDQYIVDYVRDYMEEKYDIDLEEDEYVDELQELYIKAENAKIQLSNKNAVTIVLKIGKIKEQIQITREQFEGMIKKVYGRTEGKMKEALKEAGLQPDAIDKVLLVGGSSRIPYIVQRMKDFTGKEPSKEVNPDEAVAIGAALYANMNVNNDKERQFTDVCSHSIGVVVIDDLGQEENEVIIPRNSKLPVENKQRFRTAEKDQKMICLTITEGEYRELTDVTIIGNVDIDLPPQLPQNTLILLTISLDRHQLINIRFEVPDRNFKQEYQMKRIANMDEDEVRHVTGMLRDYTIN
jgi:molecular chaperone DnaK